MSILASTIVPVFAAALSAVPAEPARTVTVDAVQVANLTESESFRDYRRLLRDGASMPILSSEKETRSRVLRKDPILIGISR